MTGHWIGMTITATTRPAMKLYAVYTLAFPNGLVGSAPSTLNNGIHPNHVDNHRAKLMTRPCRKKSPQRP